MTTRPPLAPDERQQLRIDMPTARPLPCPRCHTFNPPQARFCQHCRFRIVLAVPGAERYQIARIIKSGGMGAVYEAVDPAGQRYAIKELLDRFARDDERAEALAHFADEARLLQRLRHPSVPRVYANFADTFVDGATGEQRQHYYLVMDFIQGEDLEQRLEREGAQGEALTLMWADQLCDVLGYLHASDLIYRDVKPSNIMIERDSGRVKLVDFGIATLAGPGGRGTLIGTPGYSPPEQYQGLTTPASDIYALGATLHHLLSGRDPRPEPPFSFPPLRQLRPDVSPHVASAIDRALSMHSAERWGSMREFRAALLAAERVPAPVVAAPPTPVASAPPANPRPRPSFLRRLLRLLLPLLIAAPFGLAAVPPDYVREYAPVLVPVAEQLDRYLP
jgi:serine/threonine protein kinase